MSAGRHPNDNVHNYISNELLANNGLELTKCESKVSIVFDEEEISWIYTFEKPSSDVKVMLTISDPIYFCEVSINKNENTYFALKAYVKNLVKSNDIEDLLNSFYDEKIDEEEYTLGYLALFKKYTETEKLQNIIDGNEWPEVPADEE